MTILALAVLENNEEPVAKAWINHLISKNPRISELRLLIRLKEEDFLKNLYSDELREAEEEERQKLRY